MMNNSVSDGLAVKQINLQLRFVLLNMDGFMADIKLIYLLLSLKCISKIENVFLSMRWFEQYVLGLVNKYYLP